MAKMNWDTKRMAQYRTFNGRRYYATAHTATKKEAQNQKRLWQKMHRYVRIVPVATGYAIYISDVSSKSGGKK